MLGKGDIHSSSFYFYSTPNKKPLQLIYLQGLSKILFPLLDEFRNWLCSSEEAKKLCQELAAIT